MRTRLTTTTTTHTHTHTHTSPYPHTARNARIRGWQRAWQRLTARMTNHGCMSIGCHARRVSCTQTRHGQANTTAGAPHNTATYAHPCLLGLSSRFIMMRSPDPTTSSLSGINTSVLGEPVRARGVEGRGTMLRGTAAATRHHRVSACWMLETARVHQHGAPRNSNGAWGTHACPHARNPTQLVAGAAGARGTAWGSGEVLPSALCRPWVWVWV